MTTISTAKRKPADVAADGEGALKKTTFPTLQRGLHKAAPIIRSDPFQDLTPFIENLWNTRPEMCRSVFTDLFPRGENGQGATKDEEDTFVARFFNNEVIVEQSSRFLKQVLYCIALYNNTRVVSDAKKWKETHPDLFSDAGIVEQMLKTSRTRVFFDETDVKEHHNDEQFLLRMMRHVQYEITKARAKDATQITETDIGSSTIPQTPRQSDAQTQLSFKVINYDAATQTPRKISDKVSPTSVPHSSAATQTQMQQADHEQTSGADLSVTNVEDDRGKWMLENSGSPSLIWHPSSLY